MQRYDVFMITLQSQTNKNLFETNKLSFFIRIFAVVMYKLRDILTNVYGMPHDEMASDELFCSESNLEGALLTNRMQDTLAGYSYTLVRDGWMQVIYNGQVLTLSEGDLFIYSPGCKLTIVGGSDDYRSVVLIVDEQTTLEMPSVRNIISTAYYPVAELGQPVIHLSEEQTMHFWNRIEEMIRYLHSTHRFVPESLRTLYAQFLLDLMDVMKHNIGTHHNSERSLDLFISFMRLLPQHFLQHHDIAFYASQLCITTTHLSRVVRQITGRTVVDYINQMLAMEASFLLQTTDLPLTAIAERLCFADQSSFSKFFLRMKGINPKRFRMEK